MCRRGFTTEAAQVVCRQLGLADPVGASLLNTYGQYYGDGSGQVWLDDVSCRGNETSLSHCTHSQWREHSCGHDTHVFLTCFGQLYCMQVTTSCNDGLCPCNACACQMCTFYITILILYMLYALHVVCCSGMVASCLHGERLWL